MTPYPQPDVWLDVGKAFIGAFFGAGFAFATNMFVQWRQRRIEHIKAGNLAIAILREMQDAFFNIRKNMLEVRNQVLQVSPDAPLWLHFKPTGHPFDEDLKFDLTALAFLFDKHGVEAVQKLSLAQSYYRSLLMLVDEHRKTKEAIQSKMGALGVQRGAMVPAGIQDKIGLDLVDKANDLTAVALKHFQKDEAVYAAAYNFLKAELVRQFGEKFVSIGPAKGFSMAQDEAVERRRLYERTRDEINVATRSMSENLDKSLLTLSSGFLGGSLAFVNQVVTLATAEFMWMLYCSWAAFVLCISVTIAALAHGVLQQRVLHDAAEKYYMQGDQSAWSVSDRNQRMVFRWNILCCASFVFGILLLSLFVVLNLT